MNQVSDLEEKALQEVVDGKDENEYLAQELEEIMSKNDKELVGWFFDWN